MKHTGRRATFRELDHTADLRLEIYGKDRAELFRNAIEALYIVLGLTPERERPRGSPGETVRIQGPDPEEVLIRLLNELLYRANEEGRQLIPEAVSVGKEAGGEKGFEVVVTGWWYSLSKEEMDWDREIKAVTYHDVLIRPTDEGLSARVVFDI